MPALHQKSIGMAAFAIAGLPVAWNIVARNEYRNHTIERVVGGKKRGAYCLALAIFLASFARDAFFHAAVTQNPCSVLPVVCSGMFDPHTVKRVLRIVGGALVTAGSALVVAAFARLGVTGTYLGDYFGITMDERVTAFPFSHFNNPMYLGASLNFLGAAVAQNSGVGVLLTGWIALVYHISTTYYEGPFTSMIYKEMNDAKKNTKAGKQMSPNRGDSLA